MRIGSRRLSLAIVSALALGASSLGCDEYVQGEGAGEAHEPDPSNPAHHEVPTVGDTKSGLEGVDDAVKAWMRATCAGAVSLSVGFGAKPLLSRGYGKMEGPPSILCQDKHGADKYQDLGWVMPDTPFRIGSNSKAITAAIVRDVLKKRLAEKGRPATDDELEGLLVFDPDLDLVSPRLRRYVMANLAVAGVACESPVDEANGRPVVSGGKVDPRWLDITVGQLLSHRSGLTSDGNSVYRKLPELRGLVTAQDLDDAELQTGAPEEAKQALRGARADARFVPRVTLEEYLLANTDLCFAFDPGGQPPAGDKRRGYSNLAFGVLEHIAEHVSGDPLAAPLGWDELHGSSLLGKFMKEKLGVVYGAGSKHGIYLSQSIREQRDPSEVSYRWWDGTRIKGQVADVKRPHCAYNHVFEAVKCNDFIAGHARFNWDWKHERVDVSYERDAIMTGAGLFAAEMPLYQKFMARYWVSGGPTRMYYGRERAANPSSITVAHNGGLSGSFSAVRQFVGADAEYRAVPRKDGELDLASLTEGTPKLKCKLPSGLNLALATNQSHDSACGDACGIRYEALADVVQEALCKVDWTKVSPQIANK
ncbi:MAG: serine hydrolase [Labilithrix sp.]|nr:serine hydrolase [Labilithrix sp.]